MTDRAALLDALAAYAAFDAGEEEMRVRMHAFVAANPACFLRSSLTGHITASCWIVDTARQHGLLVWHKRLNRWLQPGGHVEPDDPTLLDAALREAREECGLTRLWPLAAGIFDLDVHPIPAKGREPAHFHYDVRYLLEADPGEPLVASPESREVAWVTFDQVTRLNPDVSMQRMLVKTPSPASRA